MVTGNKSTITATTMEVHDIRWLLEYLNINLWFAHAISVGGIQNVN
jgi:hypothetical protein